MVDVGSKTLHRPSTTVADPADGDDQAGELPFSDAELTALALAADPDQPLDVDAVPLDLYPEQAEGALPSWYMPPVMARTSRRWWKPVVLAIVVAFLLIDALGLCITYGVLVPA